MFLCILDIPLLSSDGIQLMGNDVFTSVRELTSSSNTDLSVMIEILIVFV